jgi:hypothetical protein
MREATNNTDNSPVQQHGDENSVMLINTCQTPLADTPISLNTTMELANALTYSIPMLDSYGMEVICDSQNSAEEIESTVVMSMLNGHRPMIDLNDPYGVALLQGYDNWRATSSDGEDYSGDSDDS